MHISILLIPVIPDRGMEQLKSSLRVVWEGAPAFGCR